MRSWNGAHKRNSVQAHAQFWLHVHTKSVLRLLVGAKMVALKSGLDRVSLQGT